MQAYIEKEDSKKLKQKQRERMQPKMGKMDIDYQVYVFFIFVVLNTILCLSICSHYFNTF
jgi:ribonuclease HII